MARKTFSDKKKSHISRVTYTSALGKEIENAILWRDALEVHDIVHGKSVVVTPKYIDADRKVKLLFRGISTYAEDHIREMTKSSSAQSLNSRRMSMNSVKAKSSTRLGVKLSLDEIIQAIGSSGSLHEFHNYYHELSHAKSKPLPFIKVVLRKSPAYVLYHQNSVTVPKGSEEGEAVEHDNLIYDYLTIGKGKIRRRSDAETQTVGVLKKSRIESTVLKKFSEKGAYVSFFEMFDTYQQLLKTPMALNERHSVSTGVLDLIAKNPQFSYAAMVVERILASNCYHEGQRRYRNMEVPTKMAKYAEYKYSLNLLYRLLQPKFQGGYDFRRKAISAMSFCQGNGDLIAVAYGFYSDASKVTVPNGNVCVWSMKNPQNPERIYSYPVPVSAVEFSPFLPFLIAVGLYDGSVQVRNISKPDYPPVAISQRSVLLSCEPVMAIQWIRQQQDNTLEADPFLALTRDGKVAKFRIIPSPYLLGMRQMELLRVEGNPEGLQSKSFMMNEEKSLDSGRHASGLHVVMHPLQDDIYYILTDEGCIQKCSLNHTHHYLEMLKVHEGSVNHMDFSPWSPKLFLTCGNDWTIRIWLEGIYQPLITLCDRYMPVHCAMWSRTHSTVIIAVNRDTVDIWDLRRTLLAPISTINIDSSFHTLARLSICGRSLAIGNERGNVLMCSFEHMPFQSHNQYAELEKALYNAIKLSPTLMQDLKNIGYFGYKLEDGHSKSVYWKYK